MRVKAYSAAILGVDAFSVEVEVEVAPGQPSFNAVGLPANAVKECGVRVRAALAHAGFKLPPRRITVNLAPADVRKDGAALDLPVATGILGGLDMISAASLDLPVAMGILGGLDMISAASLDRVLLVGELSLDGTLRRVAGALPVALMARAVGYRALILPHECASEATAVADLPVYVARTVAEVVAHLRGEAQLARARFVPGRDGVPADLDLAEVRGQETARRALEIAAAGGHNLLLIGPPGSGKSMLARRLPTILPPLSTEEAIETTSIYSVAGQLDGSSLLAARPFRAPHHDVSVAGLVGGGTVPRPGEVSLAHNGVLFLDELPEFHRAALEVLRQPLKDRTVTIVRARAAVTYPASFALVAAMNPCPCGYRGSEQRTCTCSDERVQRYLGRIPGSFLDRFDLHVELPHVNRQTSHDYGESSARVRERVTAARDLRRCRLGVFASYEVTQLPVCDASIDRFIDAHVRRYGLRTEQVSSILRVARTIADLAGCGERIGIEHVAEAAALRTLDYEVGSTPLRFTTESQGG